MLKRLLALAGLALLPQTALAHLGSHAHLSLAEAIAHLAEPFHLGVAAAAAGAAGTVAVLFARHRISLAKHRNSERQR